MKMEQAATNEDAKDPKVKTETPAKQCDDDINHR